MKIDFILPFLFSLISLYPKCIFLKPVVSNKLDIFHVIPSLLRPHSLSSLQDCADKDC